MGEGWVDIKLFIIGFNFAKKKIQLAFYVF